jgi:iron complex transport system permease protein
MNEEIPIALGIRVEKDRFLLLCLSAALAGACVAVGGGISFIGLLAPHLARHLHQRCPLLNLHVIKP